MPLEHSSSPGAFKRNVSTLMHEVGQSPHVQSQKQALAIAYATQRRGRAVGGGIAPHFDDGGGVPSSGLEANNQQWRPKDPNNLSDAERNIILSPDYNPLGWHSSIQDKINSANSPLGPLRNSGGGVANYDAGGGVDPVNAVITALTAGSQNGGGGGIGSSNAAAPSSPASTASTSPTNIVAQNATPASSTPAPAATPIAPTTAGIAQAPPAVTSGATNMNQPTATNSIAPPTPAAITAPVAPTSTVASQPTYQNGIALPAATSTLSTLNSNAQLLSEGGVANRAGGGGFNMSQGPALTAPWTERQESRGLHVGPVLSNVPGRTDNHSVKVPAGSYVLPSANIAFAGHGNTNAGMSIASRMFGQGPYGSGPTMKVGGGHGNMPHPPKIAAGPGIANLATGGYTYSDGGARGADQFDPVDVDIAGGEYVIPPQEIIRRWGSLKNGHAVLDQFVMDQRKKEMATTKALPPPAKE